MINRFLSLLWILISAYALEVCAVPPEGKVVIHGLGQGNAVVITATKPGVGGDARPKTVAILVDAGSTAASYVARQQQKEGGTNTTFRLDSQPKLGEKEPVEEDEETQEDLAADEAEDAAENKEEREMPVVRERKRSHDTADALTPTSAVTAVSLVAPPLPAEENLEGHGADGFSIGTALSTLPAPEEEKNPLKMMRGGVADSTIGLSGPAVVAPMDMDFVNPAEVLEGRDVLDTDDSQRSASSHDSGGKILSSVDSLRKKLVGDYTKNIVEQIQRSLRDADEIVVFVSHADLDHYNKLPKILSKDFIDGNTKPITIVMGGLLSQYRGTRDTPSKIFSWIQMMQRQQQTPGAPGGGAAAAAEGSRLATAPVRVLFTGTQDASGGDQPLQLAYSSLNPPPSPTPLVGQLQDLRTHIASQYGLKMDILSMNAAVKSAGDVLKATDESFKNTNSLVLRTALLNDDDREIDGSRILLPGDAEEETWRHIGVPILMEGVEEGSGGGAAAAASATAATNPNVQVDYMLLSHHGSSTEGSLTPGVLKFFNPQVLLISNGRNRDLLHPREEGINTMYEYLRAKQNPLLTDVHAVSYYQGERSREAVAVSSLRFMRRYTQAPIFTTLDNGSITIDGLEQTMTGATITVARNHQRRSLPPVLPLGATPVSDGGPS